ncbi:hypothetical protein BD560DRAFT_107435 [Blakeslea trispora]|nr:hypothetical protein BD560DRAFT_107435 [Blakeslea trispora]
MGSGYAVLGKPQNSSFLELAHTVSWCESEDQFFHCTWNNMPTWCRYCHQTGHTKFECEKSKARIICYSCQQFGHRSLNVQENSVTRSEETQRTNPLKRDNRKGYQPSNDTLKSQHAPRASRVPKSQLQLQLKTQH